jgi:hypothetical protein
MPRIPAPIKKAKPPTPMERAYAIARLKAEKG